MVTRAQLLSLGYSSKAIEHRVAAGRLHVVRRGVYAAGRPELNLHGRWLAAVLACGPEAVLSHRSAAALWEIRPPGRGLIEISVPTHVARRVPGVRIHRRVALQADTPARCHGIPVTNPIDTLIDLAASVDRRQLEAAVNEADKRDLMALEGLRSAVAEATRRPGLRAVRDLLDRHTFTLTDSELERRFLPLAREAGLPAPDTQRRVNGFRVDFYWPALGLIVETDGLRYHRTPSQQARDRLRDQAHAAAGLTPLRFTRAQVEFEPAHVRATLTAVAHRLRAGR